MEITKILQGLKGKALDLRDIELLKHTYELQAENVKQLKMNNEVLREKIESLERRVDGLAQENAALKQHNEKLTDEFAAATRSASPELDENDCIAHLESWMGSQPCEKNTSAIVFAEVDRELRLPAGTAKKYLETAARKWDYVPVRKGATTITFSQGDVQDGTWVAARRW